MQYAAAVVTLNDEESANMAVEVLDGQLIDQHQVTVKLINSPHHQPGRSSEKEEMARSVVLSEPSLNTVRSPENVLEQRDLSLPGYEQAVQAQQQARAQQQQAGVQQQQTGVQEIIPPSVSLPPTNPASPARSTVTYDNTTPRSLQYSTKASEKVYEDIQQQFKVHKLRKNEHYISMEYFSHIEYVLVELRDEASLIDVNKAIIKAHAEPLTNDAYPEYLALVATSFSCEKSLKDDRIVTKALTNFLRDTNHNLPVELVDHGTSRLKQMSFDKTADCDLRTILEDYNSLFEHPDSSITVGGVKCKCHGDASITFKICMRVKPFMVYGPFGDKVMEYDEALKHTAGYGIVYTDCHPSQRDNPFRLLCYGSENADVNWKTIKLTASDHVPAEFVAIASAEHSCVIQLQYKKPLCPALKSSDRDLASRCKQLTSILSRQSVFKDKINAVIIISPSYDIIVECRSADNAYDLQQSIRYCSIQEGEVSLELTDAKVFRGIETSTIIDNLMKDSSITDARPETVANNHECRAWSKSKNYLPVSRDNDDNRRVQILTMMSTLTRIAEDSYDDDNGVRHKLDVSAIRNKTFNRINLLSNQVVSGHSASTIVSVVNQDTLLCAADVVRRAAGFVGVLNMANETRPGGGYLTGAMAQV